MSLGARLVNMFTTPGEVFDQLKVSRPSVANWLVPVLLSAFIGVLYSVVVFSQEAIVYQIQQQQEQAMEKKLSHLSKEQRDQAIQTAQKFSGPTFLKISGSGAAVVGSFFWLFALALVLWLVGRFILKGSFAYFQALEVCGLCSMIGVLGGLMGMLLALITGNIYMTLSPALLLREFDAANPVHMGLTALNVLTFWYIAVLALGLARLSGVSWLKASLWLFIPYFLIRGGLIWLGMLWQGK